MLISAQFMPWIVRFLFPGCFLFIYLFCLFLVHSFIYISLQSFSIIDWYIHFFHMSCQWLCDADRTVGSFWIWECMRFMCIVRVRNLYGSSCKNSFQTWQKWVYFMYEFMSDIKKVDLGGGGEHIYETLWNLVSNGRSSTNLNWLHPGRITAGTYKSPI